MAKYQVTTSALWIAKQKYRRGDIVELEHPEEFGAKLQPYVEPTVEPVKKTRRRRVSNEDRGKS